MHSNTATAAALTHGTDSPGIMTAVGEVLRLGAYTAWDRVRNEHPRQTSSIPYSIEMITAEWLTSALCSKHPSARVESFERGNASKGSTSRESMRVHYNAAGRSAGLPEYIFVKMTPTFTSRLICTLSGATRTELGFYSKVRGELDIEAPPAFYGDCSQQSGRSVFLFEDISKTKGCRFLNTDAVITRPQAEGMVTLLAKLHGRYWNSPRLEKEFSWLRTPTRFMNDTASLIGFKRRSLIGLKRGESVMPAQLVAQQQRIWPAVIRSLDMNSEHPRTYLHHDVHIGNWYCTGAGQMGLTDWQLNVKGQWASDVTYALSSGLQVADRRAWERDLIKLYLQELAATGAPTPDFNSAWLQYRQQQFHGFAFWLYTLGYGPMQPQMQPDAYSFANLERMSNAIADLESLAAVEKNS